jgi:phosphoribosylformylglycinamidine synthase
MLQSRDEVQTSGNSAPATLTWNTNGRYTAKWVELNIGKHHSPFLQGIERMYLPIAHAEGRIVFRDEATADRLEQAGQLALRYATNAPHENPNGSDRAVAGICDPTGHVFGLMPHPERNIQLTHHPHWTRLSRDRRPDGLPLFENAVSYFG